MTESSRNDGKRISLCINNEGLRLFLAALLCEWGFTCSVTCPEDPEEILLADDSCSRCADHGKRINLISSVYIDTDHVNLPINPDHFWRVFEKHFHRPPRHHLRLAINYQVSMKIRGQEYSGELNSLSPAGGRLSLPRELAMGELVPIILPLTPRPLSLQGKVIYVTTFSDQNNRYDAGILFEKISAEDKALLRETIILGFFANIRAQLPRWAFEIGISHFDLSPALRNQL